MVSSRAAAFRRLCVETPDGDTGKTADDQPPLGGCVLKLFGFVPEERMCPSRL